MRIDKIAKLCYENFLFWLSRRIDYPLLPPDMTQVNFTFRCNLSCKMCSMNSQMQMLKAQGKPTEIDSDVFRKIIDQTEAMKIKNLLFIGGEPLLRKDLFGLVEYASEKQLNTVIVTNGVLLDQSAIMQCFKSKVNWLSISIDAAKKEKFEQIRGTGSFDKIIENIKLLNDLKKEHKKESPNIVTVCTIMDDNIDELDEIVKLSQSLNISRIIFQPVVFNNADQSDRSKEGKVFIKPERFKALDQSIEKLIKFKKTSRYNYQYIANSIGQLKKIRQYLKGKMNNKKLPCYAGYNRLQITQDHVVYFCIPPNKDVSSSFGDVSKDALHSLWYGKEARIRRKLIKQCNQPCMQWCSYRDEFIALGDVFYQTLLFGRQGK